MNSLGQIAYRATHRYLQATVLLTWNQDEVAKTAVKFDALSGIRSFND